MKFFTVMGNPVCQSLSPIIHHEFAKQFDIALTYDKTHVPLGAFPPSVKNFFNSGGTGTNITTPFKREAFELADKKTNRALKANCANVLYLDKQNKLVADNTDNSGFLTDFIENIKYSLGNKKILIIGAGAVATSLLPVLLELETQSIKIVNRNPRRAQAIAATYSAEQVMAIALFELVKHEFDVIIHASSAGLDGMMPNLPRDFSANGAICYDVCYGLAASPFLNWAKDHGASQIYDGLGMLVEQAAESFLIWHGKKPKTAPIISLLQSQYVG